MSLELSNKAADAAIDTFMPEDYLLGIVQHVIASRVSKRIVLQGKGEVVILPERGVYFADVQDMAEFCSAPSADFTTTDYRDSVLLSSSKVFKGINNLLWDAAFHASQGRLILGCSKSDIVKFRHWPNLSRLAVTPNAARICALLTRHRTTILLVDRILGIDDKEVYRIYSAAHSAGISNAVLNFKTTANDPQPELERKFGLFRALFAKISGL